MFLFFYVRIIRRQKNRRGLATERSWPLFAPVGLRSCSQSARGRTRREAFQVVRPGESAVEHAMVVLLRPLAAGVRASLRGYPGNILPVVIVATGLTSNHRALLSSLGLQEYTLCVYFCQCSCLVHIFGVKKNILHRQ